MSRHRTSLFSRCFLPAEVSMWNDSSLSLTPEGWMGFIRVQSIVGYFTELCFLVLRGAGACGVAKAIYNLGL